VPAARRPRPSAMAGRRRRRSPSPFSRGRSAISSSSNIGVRRPTPPRPRSRGLPRPLARDLRSRRRRARPRSVHHPTRRYAPGLGVVSGDCEVLRTPARRTGPPRRSPIELAAPLPPDHSSCARSESRKHGFTKSLSHLHGVRRCATPGDQLRGSAKRASRRWSPPSRRVGRAVSSRRRGTPRPHPAGPRPSASRARDLSQPASNTAPSSRSACMIVSTESAITSRETSGVVHTDMTHRDAVGHRDRAELHGKPPPWCTPPWPLRLAGPATGCTG
jgi:hypothetical protein